MPPYTTTAPATTEERDPTVRVDLRRVLARVDHLKQLNQPRRAEMTRIRDIMDGGRAGLVALLGPAAEDFDENEAVPVVNMISSGIARVAHRLGRVPDLRVDPPRGSDEADDQRPREAAEKRARIVNAYDEQCGLEMALPQAAQWLVGYGFTPFVLTDYFDRDGNGYPKAELRDSYTCWPAEWGVAQQPIDVAFLRRVPLETLKAIYPERAQALDDSKPAPPTRVSWGGGVLLEAHGQQSWEGNTRGGVEVAEYYDKTGVTIVAPERKVVLDHIPTGLDRPPFVLAKRFSFNQLQGQFDQGVGLMASLVKMNLLMQIQMEDNTMVETNVYGDMDGQYRKGRDAVNYFAPGTQVDKPTTNMPYQIFEHVGRSERQFRLTTRYSNQADGESPQSFATGRGLEQLQTGMDHELREYQTVLRHAIQGLDSIRLEYDEKQCDYSKPLIGYRNGAYTERYRPSTHIKGNYRTRRIYGVMAGWDEPSKIVTGLQLLQAEIIDDVTFRENLDGLDDPTAIERRIRAKRVEQALMSHLLEAGNAGDPRAVMALTEMLPEGDMRAVIEKYFTDDGEEMTDEEQMLMEQALGGGGPGLPSQPPDVTTVLSQLGMGGELRGGAQTVGRMG